MRQLVIVGIILLLVGPSSHSAHADLYGESFGEIYLTYDAEADPGTACSNCNDYDTDPILPFVEFAWYLVIYIDFADVGLGEQNTTNGLQAWEAYVSTPDEITVTRSSFAPAGSVNVGFPPLDANDSNWIVGTGSLVSAASTPFAVVEYGGLLLAEATDLEIAIGGSQPSSFTAPGGPGEVPGWVEHHATGECERECLRGFAGWADCESTLVVNYTHRLGCLCRCKCCAAKTASWGAIKARF